MPSTDYSIIDWAYDKIEIDDFKSRDDVQSKIDAWARANARDSGKSWEAFKAAVPGWFEKESKEGITLSEKMDSYNQKYIDDIRREIDQANTEDKLNEIKLDEGYEWVKTNKDDVREIIDAQIGEKIEKVGEDAVEGLESRIKEAGSYADLSQVSKDIDKSGLSKEVKDRLNEEWRSKTEQFESAEERDVRDALSAIRNASSQEDLDRIDLSNITDRKMDEINNALEARRNELSTG